MTDTEDTLLQQLALLNNELEQAESKDNQIQKLTFNVKALSQQRSFFLDQLTMYDTTIMQRDKQIELYKAIVAGKDKLLEQTTQQLLSEKEPAPAPSPSTPEDNDNYKRVIVNAVIDLDELQSSLQTIIKENRLNSDDLAEHLKEISIIRSMLNSVLSKSN